jgi:protein DGCR14
MSLRRISENKALILVPTADGGGKLVEAKPQEVVEEETFVDSVSSILDRDFFPELPKLRAYNEYLDAVQARDYAKMAEVRFKWRQVGTQRLSCYQHCRFEIWAAMPLYDHLLTSCSS